MGKESKKPKKKTGEKYRSFRLTRRVDRPLVAKLPSIWWLLKETYGTIRDNWKLFLGLGVIYTLFYKLMVLSLIRTDVASVRAILIELNESRLSMMGTLFSAAAGTSASSDGRANLFANVLTVLFILCTVWALRQIAMGKDIKIRDALYSGTGQFFSFMATILVVFVQSLPMAIGFFVYATAKASNTLNGGVEDLAVFVVAVLMTTLSLYWMTCSVVALVTATVPGMYPLAALRATKDMVAYRRFPVFLRLIGIVLAIAVVWLLVLLLFVASGIAAFIAPEIVDVLRGLTLIFAVIYMYKLYRALLVQG